MKRLLFLFLISSTLLSCESNNELTDESVAIDYSRIQMCTEMVLDDEVIEIIDTVPQLRAYMELNRRWKDRRSVVKNPITITIKFLNGDSYLQSKVRQYAEQWLTPTCLIKFQWVASNVNADIKIAFKWNNDGSSWSYIGTDCKSVSQNNPSMNFGWLDYNTSEIEFSRLVLHEFGHALGFVHEHQHPFANIPWNKSKVYEYYATQNWSKARVDQNFFNIYPNLKPSGSDRSTPDPRGYSDYDKTSIMHYAVDASLTIGGYSVPWNYYLSETDKEVFLSYY